MPRPPPPTRGGLLVVSREQVGALDAILNSYSAQLGTLTLVENRNAK